MTTQSLAPNLHVGTFLGTKDQTFEIDVSPQYLDNVITIIPQSTTGVAYIKAAVTENTGFENVENGIINYSVERTLRISGYPIRSFQVVMSETVPFTIYVKQYRGDNE